jgi:integral membrane sensor domain MASE1
LTPSLTLFVEILKSHSHSYLSYSSRTVVIKPVITGSFFVCFSVNVIDGEFFQIQKMSRLHMAAYLCIGKLRTLLIVSVISTTGTLRETYVGFSILLFYALYFSASNGIPPSISKRVEVKVQCK